MTVIGTTGREPDHKGTDADGLSISTDRVRIEGTRSSPTDLSPDPSDVTGPRRVLGAKQVALVLFVVGLYSYHRGLLTQIQLLGEPFFYIDYSSGPIKRGLVGQTFDLLLDRTERASMTRWILAAHFSLSAMVLYILVDAVRSAGGHGSDRRAVSNLIFAVFATSAFLPTTALNTGYLDVYVFAAFVVATLVIPPRWAVAGSALIAVATLVHEMALFFLLSFVILHCARAHRAATLSWGFIGRLVALPALTAVILYAAHSDSAATNEVLQSPVSDEIKSTVIEVQFKQSITSATGQMLDIWTGSAANAAAKSVFYLAPTILMMAFYLAWRRPDRTTTLIVLAASLAPLSILGIAWDLSRFLVNSQLASLVTILFLERHILVDGDRSTPPIPRWWPLLVAATVLGLLVPFTYSYFGSTFVINADMTPGFLDRLVETLLNLGNE